MVTDSLTLSLCVVANRVPMLEQLFRDPKNKMPSAHQFFWSPKSAYQLLTSFFDTEISVPVFDQFFLTPFPSGQTETILYKFPLGF
jgi:hypothetical protein